MWSVLRNLKAESQLIQCIEMHSYDFSVMAERGMLGISEGRADSIIWIRGQL